jgi:hypothetical protein
MTNINTKFSNKYKRLNKLFIQSFFMSVMASLWVYQKLALSGNEMTLTRFFNLQTLLND